MKTKLFILFLAILLVGVVSASFSLGNVSHSVERQYSPSDSLIGWINISLDNEPINSLFSTNFNDHITLLDLILINDLDDGTDYTCSPSDCTLNYASISGSGETYENLVLNKDQEQIYGLRIIGGIVTEISNFSMDISSTAGNSYAPQLYIDIFADGIIEWQAYKSSGNYGSERSGCYASPASGSAPIFNREYCEKINLPVSPDVKIGANVLKVDPNPGEVEFIMTIQKDDNSNFGTCIATAQNTGKTSCIPEQFKVSEEGDFFVCISTQNQADEEKYSINHETTEPCGFTDYYTGSYSRDFDIFAKSGSFDALGQFTLNNDELNNAEFYNYNIENDIHNYIAKRYSNDCSEECIVPIKLISGYGNSGDDDSDPGIDAQPILEGGHDLRLSNIALTYTTDIRDTADTIYNLISVPAKVNSDFIQIGLDDAELYVPSSYGNSTFILELANQQVFLEIITIEQFPEINFLTPRKTAAAVPTTFKVGINLPDDVEILSYEWDFGDNTTEITATQEIEHVYESSGTYLLEITLVDDQDLSVSQSFNITVESPKVAVKSTLNERKNYLSNIKSDIEYFTDFQKDSLESIFNLNDIENQLNQIQSTYDSATNYTDEQTYITMMGDLLAIDLPSSIELSQSAESIVFYPLEENIDIDAIQVMGGEDYRNSQREDYVNSVLFWNQENLETKISFYEITANYNSFSEPILKTFSFEITKNYLEGENPSLIIKSIDDLTFKENYFEQEQGGYFYIEILDTQEVIEFSTTEDFNFVDIPAFISPDLSQLVLIIPSSPTPEIDWKWAIVGGLIILIILLGLGAYTFLQKWYKNKYESHLFKNKNDLYNILSYTHRMEKKGMKKRDIAHNLKRARWTGEQIKYAMKKYSKKNTGMFEIPVEKLLEKLKEKSEERPSRR